MPGGPAPHCAHDRRLHASRAAGSAGAPVTGSRRWMLPTRGRASPVGVAGDDVGAAAEVVAAARRAGSRARARRVPAALDRVDQAGHHRRRRSRCASRADRAQAEHAVVSSRRPAAVGSLAVDVGHRPRRTRSRDRGERVRRGRRAPPGRVGQAHRAVLAARQQDRRVSGRGQLAALVLGRRARGRPRVGRRRRGTCARRVPRSHCVSPT